MLAHAAETPAVEVCGLLFGTADEIVDARACANVAADPARRFEVDPAALFAAMRAERAGGPGLIGGYHSHPSGDPTPSPCDAAMAEPGRLWLLIGGGRITAWWSVTGGPLHGMFAPVDLDIAG
ncbi:M67 family metallopeptidase [Sphingomonas solaris]|uniref:M67 family metallopeptidase n=2 Tax=Alterirhizorhabdus solaris TaxID=2529389 RepID=A0A558QWU5_9SPHN|nr:M67 family metallopeptidase [Sphingomonas solaris]